MDYQHSGKDRSLGLTEVSASALLTEGDDKNSMPWLSTGLVEKRDSLKSDNRKTVKGQIYYSAEFFPCENLRDVQFEEPGNPLGLVDEADESEDDADTIDPENNDSPKINGNLANRKRTASLVTTSTVRTPRTAQEEVVTEPEGVQMSREQILSSQSGILVVDIIGGQLARKGARLELFVNSEYWPACMPCLDSRNIRG